MEGLRAVVGKANDLDVDIVLVAGDLFDNARVGDEAVALTISELSRFERPVVVIPGNHDCVDERSIYHRVDLTSAGEHVFFAGNPAGEELVFERPLADRLGSRHRVPRSQESSAGRILRPPIRGTGGS